MALFAIAGMATAAVLQSAEPSYIGISSCALVLFGGGAADIRGSIGGNVFSRNSSGAYIRNRTKPVNPNTTKQNMVRVLFSTVAQHWRNLSEGDRLTWITLAPTFERLNRLGQSIPLTGFQLFQKCNANLKSCGHAIVNVIGDVNTPVQQLVDGVILSWGAGQMEIESEDATVHANTSMRVYATAPRSAGSKFAGPSEYRLIKVLPAGEDLNSYDLTSDYIAVFGTYNTANLVVGFKFDSVLTATGLNNAAQSIQVIAAA